MDKVKDNAIYYIFLDEIQKVEDFESVLNSFLRKNNLDVYVTGSNSKILSTDIITEFRGGGYEDDLGKHTDTANMQSKTSIIWKSIISQLAR